MGLLCEVAIVQILKKKNGMRKREEKKKIYLLAWKWNKVQQHGAHEYG